MTVEIFDVRVLKKTGDYRFSLRIVSADSRPLFSVHGFRYNRAAGDFLYPVGYRFSTIANISHPKLRDSIMHGLEELIESTVTLSDSELETVMKNASIPVYTDATDQANES